MSQYEERILKILKQNKIYYQREKTFSTLKEGKLRYDIFIPNYRGKSIIIEVNGEQHYSIVKKFHKTRADFLKYQENDRRKISWGLSNNYIYYCIPFWKINQITTLQEIFCVDNQAFDRWKNDNDWRKFCLIKNLKTK